ncbi:hypothetical protein CLG96_04520 [Sphingomonas oleivorans]|uniref:Response regulatory domain-containing protein n=2 Tax=Sphingomonas oleivorans TaxID=1735121 RepID=A0A2T5G389_9SPHN|nr:hypothetical protein CLG96_04520 [Sphingomonas oleivorans]
MKGAFVDCVAGRRILIVEDEYILADDMKRGLKQHGAIIVGPVPGGAEAEAMLATEAPIDGAVLDIDLAQEKSCPLADMLRERHVPFILATSDEDASLPARYADVVRCEKPFDPDSIVKALELAEQKEADRSMEMPAQSDHSSL